MPIKIISLAQAYNTRGILDADPTTDARIVGAIPIQVPNTALRTAAWYLEKRPGWEAHITPAGSVTGYEVYESSINQSLYSAFADGSNTVIYSDADNIGTISGTVRNITDTTNAGGAGAGFILFNSSSGSGWYVRSNVTNATATFTGNITSGQTTISGFVSNTNSDVLVGQLLSNGAIAAGSRIATISGTQVIMDTAAISTTAAAVITRTNIAKIIDADFPFAPSSNVSCPLIEMDGYLFTLDFNNGRIYQSDLNSIHEWGASNYITVNRSTDDVVGLGKFKNQIVCFGTRAMEFFYNAGNISGSILSPTKQAYIGIGTMSSRTICNLMDKLYWIGSGYGANGAVYTLDGYTPVKISTPTIEKILSETVPTVFTGFTAFGQTCLYISNATATLISNGTATQLLYLTESKQWVEPGFNLGYAIAGGSGNWLTGGAVADIYAVSRTSGTGRVYRWRPTSTTVYQDDTVAYTMTIQTERHNFGTNKRKRINRISLIADNQTSGNTSLSVSTDDYTSFGTARNLDMTGNYKTEKGWGVGRSWAFRLEHSANTAWRGEALEVEYEVLDS